jgi:hypothetical protein
VTPLSRFLAKYLPGFLVWPALALIYAALLVLVTLMLGHAPANILYLDVHGGQ